MPVCHAYARAGEDQQRFPAALTQCQSCGLVQMLYPFPLERLVPPFDWIRYNEPEQHLEALVNKVCGLPGVSAASVIAGLGANDESTLDRFRRRGFVNTWLPDSKADLNIGEGIVGTALVQDRINAALGRTLRLTYGVPDVMIVRMMLEHAYSPITFLQGIASLLGQTSYLVLEVPDCQNSFEILDYTVIWEEHLQYFTAATLNATLRHNGFSICEINAYPTGGSSSLVAIAQKATTVDTAGGTLSALPSETSRMKAFAKALPRCRQAVRTRLSAWRQGEEMALLGAGHDSVVFVALMGIADLLSFVVDDHPAKIGYCLPGTSLPIRASSSLYSGTVGRCLLGAGSGNEARIIAKHRKFELAGGSFSSIYPQSTRYPFGEESLAPGCAHAHSNPYMTDETP